MDGLFGIKLVKICSGTTGSIVKGLERGGWSALPFGGGAGWGAQLYFFPEDNGVVRCRGSCPISRCFWSDDEDGIF